MKRTGEHGQARSSHGGSRAKRHRDAPWTLAGGPDPTCDDDDRLQTVWQLTDPDLEVVFEQARGRRDQVDYDTMIRGLDLVWDCPADHTVNVTGYLCAGCHASRAALEPSAHRPDGRASRSPSAKAVESSAQLS